MCKVSKCVWCFVSLIETLQLHIVVRFHTSLNQFVQCFCNKNDVIVYEFDKKSRVQFSRYCESVIFPVKQE